VGSQYRSAAELLDFSLFRAWSIAGTKYSVIPGRTDFENRQAEALIACNILNRMTELGRPESFAIGA